MASYPTAQLDTALDLLGEIDPASVESAHMSSASASTSAAPEGGGDLRRANSKLRWTSSAKHLDPGTGYYPELAELVDEKLRALQNHSSPFGGLLGDGRDVPDVDHDLVAKLQGLNSVMDSIATEPRPRS